MEKFGNISQTDNFTLKLHNKVILAWIWIREGKIHTVIGRTYSYSVSNSFEDSIYLSREENENVTSDIFVLSLGFC